MKEIKIAVIGVGLGGKIHIKRIKDNPLTALDSVIAPDREANHEFARNENVPLFHSIEECLAKRKPDGIIIASPNYAHKDHTIACINAGIPALLEKPVTSVLAEGVELIELVNKKNAAVLVGHHRAHNPILKAARNLIDQGRLGRLVSVMGSAQFYKPDHYFEDGPWRKVKGGGPILINLIHEIDNLRRLVGEISAVQAIASNNIRGFEVEDTVVVNIVFKNGVLGTFTLSDTAATARSWEQTTKENPGYPSYQDEDCYLIAGTSGSIAIPTMRFKYYADGITPSWWSPFAEEIIEVKREDPIDKQLQHFVEMIRGNISPLVTVEDGYRNLLITDAIIRSAAAKCLINV